MSSLCELSSSVEKILLVVFSATYKGLSGFCNQWIQAKPSYISIVHLEA